MPLADDSSTGAYRRCSHLANAAEAAPETASLTREFDFQHGVSFSVIVALKCTVSARDNEQTDRQTERS